jgi:hypothetical protein
MAQQIVLPSMARLFVCPIARQTLGSIILRMMPKIDSHSAQKHSPNFERRAKPRVHCSYPATLRGHLNGGLRYDARAVLVNMSASGMYFHVKRNIAVGETLFALVRMSTSPLSQPQAPQLAVSGEVERVDLNANGTYGIALRLHSHRFV